jgi:Mn2+/Fe2+ NRAMP family transporter
LATQATATTPPERARLTRHFLLAGPGLLFILSSIGEKDLISGSIAGSTYGYSLLWLLLVSLAARFVIVDSTARYVMVSGESLLAGFGRISKWIVLLWFLVAILQRHASALATLAILGSSAHMVLPLPTRFSVAIWGLSSWITGFVLMYWGRYRFAEKVTTPLAVVLGSCLAAAATMSRPDPVTLFKGALTPVLPAAQGMYGPALVLMAVMSAATASFGNLKYSAYVHEKGWRDLTFLPRQRRELMLSMFGMFCMLAMIQIAAAGALKPRGIEVTTLEDLIPIFSKVLGRHGHTILGATLWSMAFASYVGTGTAHGIMISDVYYRFVRRPASCAERDQRAGEMPVFRWVVLYISISPLYYFFTDWTPVGLVLFKSALSLLTLPIITLAVLRLTADRKIMKAHANGLFANIVLGLTTLAALYLGTQGLVGLIGPGR